MKSQKDKSYIRRILSPSTLKGTGCGAASPPLGSLGRDGQGRGSLPQSHVPSQNLFRESTSTGRERIKSSVLDNDFMMPAQETSKSCTTWPPAGASGPFLGAGAFAQAVNHGTDHRFHGFKPVFQRCFHKRHTRRTRLGRAQQIAIHGAEPSIEPLH